VQTLPDLVATGNIGCIAQIASGTSIPVLHTSNFSTSPMAGHRRMASRALRAERRFRSVAAGAATVTLPNSEQHFASLALKENGAGETLVAFKHSGIPPTSSAVLRIGS